MSQCTQHAAYQRGFARAEVAEQVNHQPWLQVGRQGGAQGFGILFPMQLAGQVHAVAAPGIIRGVTERDHDDFSKCADGVVSQAKALPPDFRARLDEWAAELGFAGVAVSGVDLSSAEAGVLAWLEAGYHGEMDYMARHGLLRARPAELVPGTAAVISLRMNYLPDAEKTEKAEKVLQSRNMAYVSRYALGRDYHKVLRKRLDMLARRIHEVAPHAYRVFTDSAPLLEVELASRGGLGWRGKHTLLLDRQAGSWFFLGDILTSLPLQPDPPVQSHCGRCTACLEACPTGAIVAPYRLDARRCISYLTIELKGAIPLEWREAIGNRIYGCDDCQLVCPWNRFAQPGAEADFSPRHRLDRASLVELFAWTEAEFMQRMAGSPILRIGHERWLRNIAVALGNAERAADVVTALLARRDDASALVREHVAWALAKHGVGDTMHNFADRELS